MMKLTTAIKQQEKGRNRRADDSADLLEFGEVVLHIARALRHQQRHQDHDRGMAEGEEEPDRHRPPILLHQFSRHIVDGGDVVGVNRVPQAKAVGQKTQAECGRVSVKHGQRQRPGGDVQANEEEVDQTDATAQGILLGISKAAWRSL